MFGIFKGAYDFEWAVKLNRCTLKLIGLWPETKQTTWQRCMCNLRALVVVMSLLIGILIPAIHSLIRIRGDVMLMIDNLQFTLPVFTAMLRVVIFWWKKDAMSSLMDMIANDWVKPKASWERLIMITRAQTARTITMFMYGMMGICFSIAIFMPACGFSMRYLTNITDPGKPLPLQTYYVYDTTRSPQYELTFISQAISMILGVLPYTGIDNFLSLLVFHICGQLDILKKHIMHLDKFTNYANTLKSCVMDHTRLIRAIAVIEDTFNLMLLALFLYFGTLFAFYGFLILSLLEDGNYLSISRLAYLVTMVINTFGHMCAYCAVGEILVSQCNRIHYAAYSNKWYTLEPKDARDIIFLMIKTSEPLYLTAGKVFPMTMATFCNRGHLSHESSQKSKRKKKNVTLSFVLLMTYVLDFSNCANN
ncbi:odorant receptor 43a-like isoform X3 [Polyergus mexicanus]|uniref:odorant receptor 43a-like isoform X3 n=1 Tax=Polyergus mexicanus TaxID=615972 RepID=UPI0038B633FE